jgi:hypothetical protein
MFSFNNTQDNIIKYVMAAAIFFMFNACTQKSLLDYNSPQVMFIQLNMSRQSEQDTIYKIELININLREGVLKNTFNETDILDTKKLKVSFIDKKKQHIETIYIDDPLNETFEYVDEQKQFKEITIKHKQKSSFIRIPFNQNYHWIIIEKNRLNNSFLSEKITILKINK